MAEFIDTDVELIIGPIRTRFCSVTYNDTRESGSRGAKLDLSLVTAWPGTKDRMSTCLGAHWKITVYEVYQLRKGRRFKGKSLLLLEEGANLLRLLFNPELYERNRLIACEYCHYSTLLFAKWLRLLGIPTRVYLFNYYIHGLGNQRAIQGILKYLLKTNVGLMVQSKTELTYFRQLSSSADIRFSPYCRAEITDVTPDMLELGDYVFAGGYTNRDYDLLLRCAAILPENSFVIVCSRLNVLSAAVPGNVKVLRDIPAHEFHKLLAASRVVVVPLRDDVGSAGQMVAIAAMQFAKTTIYPNFDVISQYFEDQTSGLMYKAGNIDSLRAALSFAVSNSARLLEIGINARQRWEALFRPENFISAICAHINDFAS
jgi:glycosyltransferase involved in cell wall biosynthesis